MAKPNPFVRGWKYFSAWFGAKVDEKADPKIQIQQAIAEAQQQHQALTRQAASVIGNQRQLEMKLSRQLTEVENSVVFELNIAPEDALDAFYHPYAYLPRHAVDPWQELLAA